MAKPDGEAGRRGALAFTFTFTLDFLALYKELKLKDL